MFSQQYNKIGLFVNDDRNLDLTKFIIEKSITTIKPETIFFINVTKKCPDTWNWVHQKLYRKGITLIEYHNFHNAVRLFDILLSQKLETGTPPQLPTLIISDKIVYHCPKCKSVKDKDKSFLESPIPPNCSEYCTIKEYPEIEQYISDKKITPFDNVLEEINTTTTTQRGPGPCSFRDNNIIQDEKLSKLIRVVTIEAKRHTYKEKKEEYKINLRKISHNGGGGGGSGGDDIFEIKDQKVYTKCLAFTKKTSKQCNNNTSDGKLYCGVHKKLNIVKQEI